jgi:phenylpropionate dioxygenase-like ring-hydroxylating dioxygenase large terminal subunit
MSTAMKDPSLGPQYPLPPRAVEAAYYLDPAQYEREIERIFMRSWMPVCSSKELPAAKDYVVWDRLRQSLVIVRQQDGTLAAWHNVCQHRGARLVETSGQAKFGKFICPWHGFSYDLGGKCVGVPLRESFDERELVDLRTLPARVAEWNGLVWIALTGEAPELREYLADLWDELGYYHMENFEVRYRHTVQLNANWKAVMDAFNETWHVPFTHQDTLSGLMLWRDARLKICSPHSWMTLPIAKYTEAAGTNADHHQANVCHYTAFPNTIFSCFPTHLQMWSAWPLSPTRTLLTAWGVVGPAPSGLTEEKWAEQSDRNWAHFLGVLEEDAQILNGLGTVSHSLGYKRSLFNTAEGRLTAFHDEVMRRVGPR